MTHAEPNGSTERLVVIGSGPAAWTAAIYAARARLDPLLYEGSPSREMIPGGQLMFTSEVENYPGFPEGVDGQTLMMRMRAQAERFQTRVVMEDIVDIQTERGPFRLHTSGGQEVTAQAVIVATGARANWLGLAGEQRLAQTGGGVSACAVCDGALPAFRGQVLGVVGGGDTAAEEALYLTKFASQVVLIHRRDHLRASPIMAERVLGSDKIRVEWNTVVTDVLGEDFVTGVRVQDTITGEVKVIPLGGLFVAIGHTPNSAFLRGRVALDDYGYIVTPTAWRTHTSVPGIFAAGDVMDPYYRQAVTAAGTGCMAALDAERWLAHQPHTSEGAPAESLVGASDSGASRK